MPLKVLMIIPSYKPAYHYGGPVRSVAALCETLALAGGEIMVYTTNANGEEDLMVDTNQYQNIDGVHVRYFKRWTKGHFNISPSLFLEVLRKAKFYDIVHIHSWWNPIAIFTAIACIILSRKPIISTRGSVSTYSFAARNPAFKYLFHNLFGKFILKQCILHVTSLEEKNEIEKYVGNKVVKYILPNILTLPGNIYGKPVEDGLLKLVILSRIDPAKNLEMLFRVLNDLNNIPIRLCIVGKGDERYVNSLKRLYSGEHEIKWLGPDYSDDRFKILAGSDLFILPSFTENYGNAVLEALSQGTPVLVSENVGAKDFVLEHNVGWIFQSNENSLRITIEEAWKDYAKRKIIRERAPELITSHFGPLELVKGYFAMYNIHRYKFRPS